MAASKKFEKGSLAIKVFALFCDEMITKEVGGKTTKKDLNSAYEVWVSVEGGQYFKPKEITQKMIQC